MKVEVVHRDEALLVLNKPSGLPTTAPDLGIDCLVRRAEILDPEAPKLHASSRLDAEVSGLVTFARNSDAISGLLEGRRQGRYRRRYLALAEKSPEERWPWSWPISFDPRDRRKRQAAPGKGEKDARTEGSVVAEAPFGVLLELRPQTGRTHQLRVHAGKAGAPLFGDVHYGGERRKVRPDGGVITFRRVMLHCAQLRLPVGEVHLRLPPPKDFLRGWEKLGGEAQALEDALQDFA